MIGTITSDEVQAVEFSFDIDKPSKWQDKDGNWHEGIIPLDDIPITIDETHIGGFKINRKDEE